MGESDPHIHVTAKTGRDDGAVRDVPASTFGLAGRPAEPRPHRMRSARALRDTSPGPDKVTCLACREHARREHLRLAEWVERPGVMPGAAISPAQAKQAAVRHRELAGEFAEPED
ncbi:hypothetical protein [Streptomyces thermoalcalitolerans]|uniref:hypothetical protein n=1 Tax=Streptomyces thermoalcalitolerans TaxID=65605 RepID=UPI0031CFD852